MSERRKKTFLLTSSPKYFAEMQLLFNPETHSPACLIPNHFHLMKKKNRKQRTVKWRYDSENKEIKAWKNAYIATNLKFNTIRPLTKIRANKILSNNIFLPSQLGSAEPIDGSGWCEFWMIMGFRVDHYGVIWGCMATGISFSGTAASKLYMIIKISLLCRIKPVWYARQHVVWHVAGASSLDLLVLE